MKTLARRFLLAIMFTALSSAICHSQDIALDFDQALAMLPEQPKWPNGIMYYDMQDAAESFITKHSDASAVEFLKARIENVNSRKLGSLCLAKLAPANEAAENALYEQIYGKYPGAIVAIAYLHPDDGRRIAETFLIQPGPWHVRRAAVDMLVGLGNENTIEMLKQVLPHEEHRLVKKGLMSAIVQIEYRLTKVAPDEQAEWAQQEILSWRTVSDRAGPPPIKQHGQYAAAKTLHMQGLQFSPDYLAYKLDMRDILAVEIIGNQKETWAIEALKSYVMLKGALGDSARVALAKIGIVEALGALEDALIPGGDSRVNKHIMMLLELYGDKGSAEFLKLQSSDERFSERERASMKAAAKFIEKRLAQNQ